MTMFSAGPSGILGSCTLATALLDLKPFLQLQLIPNITEQHEFWRLITSHCAFASSGEVLLGGLVLYHLRTIERQFGTPKYAAFLFASSAISTILELGALWAGKSFGLNYIPGGPYAMIFAGLYQYQRVVPSTPLFTFLGVTISSKIIVYSLGLQLLVFHYPSSSVAALCGIIAAALYQNENLGLKKWRPPGFLSQFASRFILPLLSTNSTRRCTTTGSSTILDQQRQITQDHSRRRGPQSHRDPPLPPPLPAAATEEQIATLQAMFPQSSYSHIAQVIQSANNDINRAAQFLLDHPR
ncbi:11254_t:CDS:2 [Ambispora gerdemannii]|uniref:11254_t:CDS:1 n=1 Tax=Ambispora gerdemannii TaxID=144530 RepID=A0A9N9CHS8_9GLOM|nr:11254_t:CDS:2 [Ambispora gerdemannii]